MTGVPNGLGDAVRKGFVRTSLGVARITSATRERPLIAASKNLSLCIGG